MYRTERAHLLSTRFGLCLVAIMIVSALAACQGKRPLGGGPEGHAATAEEQAAAANAAAVEQSYRIGAEDVLFISVWKEPELQQEVVVRPDGGISFPLAGDLKVAGKTVKEVEDEITQRIRKYIPDAVVTVTVKQIAGYTIFVIGKVSKPGQYTLGRYVDVIQALTLAGGVTPFAEEDEITIIRRKDGKEIVFPFDYSEIKDGENLQQNILLQSGDVVVVP